MTNVPEEKFIKELMYFQTNKFKTYTLNKCNQTITQVIHLVKIGLVSTISVSFSVLPPFYEDEHFLSVEEKYLTPSSMEAPVILIASIFHISGLLFKA